MSILANGGGTTVEESSVGTIIRAEYNIHSDLSTHTLELIELNDSIKYLADTLKEEDQLRKQMTSDMSHEIRTPLTNLQNLFEAFIDGIWEPDDNNLNKCYNEVLRMKLLVDRLREIAEIEENNISMDIKKINISEEVRNIVELYHFQFDTNNIELVDAITSDIWGNYDANYLNQIVSNLISNALRYTPEGGKVIVRLNKLKNQVIIVVEDTGIGISKEDLPYVFERFYRTEKSRNTETGGMGIGLTIVKNIVESSGGSIHIESEEHIGTKVVVKI